MDEADIPNWFMLRNPKTGETVSYDCEQEPQVQLSVGRHTCTVRLRLHETRKYGVRLWVGLDVDWPSAGESQLSWMYLKNPRTDEYLTWEVQDTAAWLVPLDLVLPARVVETLIEVRPLEGRCMMSINTTAPWDRIMSDVSDEEIEQFFGRYSDMPMAARREQLRQLYAAYRGIPYQPQPIQDSGASWGLKTEGGVAPESSPVPEQPQAPTESSPVPEQPQAPTESSSVPEQPQAPTKSSPATEQPQASTESSPATEQPQASTESAPGPEQPQASTESASIQTESSTAPTAPAPSVPVAEGKKATTAGSKTRR